MDKEHKWIRLSEAKVRYGVSYRTLRKYAERAGAWKKLGGIVYVDALALDRYISEH